MMMMRLEINITDDTFCFFISYENFSLKSSCVRFKGFFLFIFFFHFVQRLLNFPDGVGT